nr:hypothetical protein [Tanacetum cinerariifolium]
MLTLDAQGTRLGTFPISLTSKNLMADMLPLGKNPKEGTLLVKELLKLAEYDMSRLRIKQYFQIQDYDLWDVIENGNLFIPVAQTTTNVNGTSTTLIPGPITAKEKVQKKNDMKEKRSQLPDNSKKGVGFVSYNVVSPPPIGLFSPLKLDLSNSDLEEFQQPEFEGYGPKTSKSVSKDISNEVIHKRKIKAMLTEDAQGTRLGTCHISLTLRNLMADMLPLEEEPKEGKLLVKELLKLAKLSTARLPLVLSGNNRFFIN